MPKKKSASSKETKIRVGNISHNSGNVNVAGGNIATHQTATGLSANDIKQLFDGLYTQIDRRAHTSVADKEDLKTDVKDIQNAVAQATEKHETIDEGFLAHRFRNIARMAPDVLDIVIKTLVNPVLGIEEVVKKIAAKAKKETKQVSK